MAPDDVLVARVRAALAGAPLVEEKRMFGGIAFMVRRRMCVSVGRDRLMLRIDPLVHGAALRYPGCRTVVMNGRQYRGYVHVDAEVVKSTRDLERWCATRYPQRGRERLGHANGADVLTDLRDAAAIARLDQ